MKALQRALKVIETKLPSIWFAVKSEQSVIVGIEQEFELLFEDEEHETADSEVIDIDYHAIAEPSLTVAKALDKYHISRHKLYKLLNSKKVEGYKDDNGQWRVNEDSLNKYLKAQGYRLH